MPDVAEEHLGHRRQRIWISSRFVLCESISNGRHEDRQENREARHANADEANCTAHVGRLPIDRDEAGKGIEQTISSASPRRAHVKTPVWSGGSHLRVVGEAWNGAEDFDRIRIQRDAPTSGRPRLRESRWPLRSLALACSTSACRS